MSENRKVRRWNSTIWTTVPDSSERKPRQAVKRISDKQRARTRNLAKLKREWIKAEFDREGFCRCQGCRRPIYDPHDAALLLDAHHIVLRARGGTDDPLNLRMICRTCHMKEHGQ